ncbi:MAG: copper chaperone NosL [Methanobacteriota archaeon]|uniref:Nitrous oxide reductase accessory protein NosL n=1 Tax=Halorutilus salinus TaxID=2487751 RepID=A0A9Q4C2J1_9EURY|nr:nitrous oxide reductase accessory protein NosL [Halorutilus salinus]
MKGDDSPSLRRREILVAVGGTAVTGCLGSGSAKTEGDGTDGDDGGKGGEADGDGFTPEPVDYPDASCDVCARNVTDHPRWNAQAVHEDGERAFFCTSGCMGAYYTSPSAFGVSDADVEGLWVTDYATRQTVDGFDAYYVFVGERDLIDMPAGRNPVPFVDEEGAKAFTRRFDELSTGDAERFTRYNMNRCVW